MSKFFSAIRYYFSKIPLVGPIVYCRASDHATCLKETVISIAFATATFWLTAFFLSLLSATKGMTYLTLLYSTVRDGELFIFAVGFLGPILLLTADDPNDAKPFPHRVWYILTLIVIGLLAAGCHAQLKAAQFGGMADLLDSEVVFQVSLFTGAAVVMVRYLALVIRKSTFTPKTELKDPEEKFAMDWSARHAAGRS